MPQIRLLDLKREYSFLKKEILNQIEQCLKDQQWILGDRLSAFEKKIKEYLKVKYTVGVASGTDALLLSLNAIALKRKGKIFFNPKDEIITTAFSFVATAEVILRSGASVVFVDIEPDTFNIDWQKIKKAITKNTVGIIVVHLFGLASAVDKIVEIAKENNLFVIEDCAQALGASLNGKRVGTFGDCGTFSFFPSKNLGGYGDGGLVATNDTQLAQFLRILRNHGQTKNYYAQYLGYNSRLDSLQAALLQVKLRYLDFFNRKRKENAQRYFIGLKEEKRISLPLLDEGCVYNLYSVKVKKENRVKLMDFLAQKGIETRIYYPYGLHQMPIFLKAKKEDLKVTEEVTKRIFSLPIHPFLKEDEVNFIIKTIVSFFHTRD